MPTAAAAADLDTIRAEVAAIRAMRAGLQGKVQVQVPAPRPPSPNGLAEAAATARTPAAAHTTPQRLRPGTPRHHAKGGRADNPGLAASHVPRAAQLLASSSAARGAGSIGSRGFPLTGAGADVGDSKSGGWIEAEDYSQAAANHAANPVFGEVSLGRVGGRSQRQEGAENVVVQRVRGVTVLLSGNEPFPEYLWLGRIHRSMGAKGPLVWRLLSAVFLLVFCILVNIGAALAVNSCDTDPEQKVAQSCWGKMPIGLRLGFGTVVLQTLGLKALHGSNALSVVSGTTAQAILSSNNAHTVNRIEKAAQKVAALMVALAVLFTIIGVIRAETVWNDPAERTYRLAYTAAILILWTVFVTLWANLILGTMLSIYALIASQEARFEPSTRSIMATGNALEGARIISDLCQECNKMSKSCAPTAVFLSVTSLIEALGALHGVSTGEVELQMYTQVILPLVSMLNLGVVAFPLWCAAKLNDSSLDMLEELALNDNVQLEPDDGAFPETINPDVARDFQLRLLFLSNALSTQNRGRGIGFKVGNFVVTSRFLLRASTSCYAIALYLWQTQLGRRLPQVELKMNNRFDQLHVDVERLATLLSNITKFSG